MNGYPESVSNKTAAGNAPLRVVIVGVNWIGDSIMCMPALQSFRNNHPAAHIAMLVKPALVPLWKMHRAPNEILAREDGPGGTRRTAKQLKAGRYDLAFILPHSFRSALIPWLAGIQKRVGLPGHWRALLLTRIVHPMKKPGCSHQAYESLDLFNQRHLEPGLDQPRLEVPESAMADARAGLAIVPRPLIGLIPGAARGPSKRWPPEHFKALGRMLAEKRQAGLAIFGSPDEIKYCEHISRAIGSRAVNLAGRLSFEQWAAALKICDVVIANDSGGMHLASALGTPVIALFGTTDPAITGPLGPSCRILQNSAIRDRKVKRDSISARKSLASIQPEQVYQAAEELLRTR